jgi:hypothetical protein
MTIDDDGVIYTRQRKQKGNEVKFVYLEYSAARYCLPYLETERSP